MDLKQAYQVLQIDFGSGVQVVESAYFEYLIQLQTGQELKDVHGAIITEALLTEAFQSIRNSQVHPSFASDIQAQVEHCNSKSSIFNDRNVPFPITSVTLRTTTHPLEMPSETNSHEETDDLFHSNNESMTIRSSVGFNQNETRALSQQTSEFENEKDEQIESETLNYLTTLNYTSEKNIHRETIQSSQKDGNEPKNVRRTRRGKVSFISPPKKITPQLTVEETHPSNDLKKSESEGIKILPSEFDHTTPLDRSGRRKMMLTTKQHPNVSKNSSENDQSLQESEAKPTQLVNSFGIGSKQLIETSCEQQSLTHRGKTQSSNTSNFLGFSDQQKRQKKIVIAFILLLMISSGLIYFIQNSMGK